MQADRPIGFGPGRIPWSTIVRYCEVYGLSSDQRASMVHHFNLMDDVYLAHAAEQSNG